MLEFRNLSFIQIGYSDRGKKGVSVAKKPVRLPVVWARVVHEINGEIEIWLLYGDSEKIRIKFIFVRFWERDVLNF